MGTQATAASLWGQRVGIECAGIGNCPKTFVKRFASYHACLNTLSYINRNKWQDPRLRNVTFWCTYS